MNQFINENIDSLPYVDVDYQDEEIQSQVNQLIEEEMRRGGSQNKKKEATDLPINVKLFENKEILKKEFMRVEKGQKLLGLEVSRYSLLEPKVKTAKEEAKLDKALEEWKSAVDNSKSQLEHMELSLVNQELMDKYAANSWKFNLYELNHLERKLNEELDTIKEDTLNLHRQRKIEQVEMGEKLNKLDSEWKRLINSTLQVDLAVQNLEAEVEYLQQYEKQVSGLAQK